MTIVPKIKYLTNKDLLREIHLSKNTYCSFTDPAYSEYDLIVTTLEKLNIRTIAEAKRNRASKMAKAAHEAAVAAAGKKMPAKEFEVDYRKVLHSFGEAYPKSLPKRRYKYHQKRYISGCADSLIIDGYVGIMGKCKTINHSFCY